MIRFKAFGCQILKTSFEVGVFCAHFLVFAPFFMSKRSYVKTRQGTLGQAGNAAGTARSNTERMRSNVRARNYVMNPRSQPVYKTSGEVKGVDTLLSGIVLETTGTNGGIFLVNAVAPGSGSFNRVGRKITLKSLRIKGNIGVAMNNNSGSAATVGQVVRMVVVFDRQPSGILPNFNVIFGFTDQAGTEGATVQSPLRYDNMSRFKVLRDCEMVTNPGTAGNAAVLNGPINVIAVDEYIKLPQLETVYSGQSATCTIADVASGGLYVIFRADPLGTYNAATVSTDTYARLRYTD